MWISPVWIASRGIEPLKESMHNKSLCECHEFSVWLLCHGFFVQQIFFMILHKLSSLCLVLYSIFIIMLVNIIFWGMHLLWNSQCEYDKHFPAFIWFNFFLNVSEQNMIKKMIQKELIEILPEYLSLRAIKVDVESNFIANVIKEIPMRNDIETGLGFIFLSATTTWHRLSFFRFRSLKNQFVPIQNGLELFPYSNHMRCKQQ